MVENSQLATGYSTKPLMNTLMTNTVVLKYPLFNTRTRNEARVNALRASSYLNIEPTQAFRECNNEFLFQY